MLDSSLLRQSTPEVVDALLAVALDRLRDARRRLAEAPDDPESVHAVRVALTRLRQGLAPWGGLGETGVGLEGAAALRRVHKALGRVRNDDVRRAYLARHAAPPDADAKVLVPSDEEAGTAGATDNLAAAVLVARLDRRRPRRLTRAVRHVEALLDPVLERVTTVRGSESADARAAASTHGSAVEPVPFHQALERALQAAGQRVLEATDHGASMVGRHRARLALKRVRALLQPWTDALPALTPLLRVATAGQDLLGEERDLREVQHFVARSVPRAVRRVSHRRRSRRKAARRQLALEGCALTLSLRDEGTRAADRVAREWLTVHGPSRVALHLALATACAALRALRPAETAPTEAAPTDAPPVEIERKFLLRDLPERVREVPGVRIAQGWLPGERIRERLRRTVHPDGRVEWTRTIKLGTGVARIEVEEATDPVLFESLWPFTSAARVEKIRHRVADGALTWEIDRFLDRALVLAEVELPSPDTVVSPPEWLAPYIVREVTDETEFVNANLARRRGHVPGI